MKNKDKNILSEFKSTLCDMSKEEKLELDASILAMGFLGLMDEVMEKRGISKKQFATEVGTSAAYITQLFRGNRKPNWTFIAKAQEVLDLKFNISTLESKEQWLQDELMDYHNRWVKSTVLKNSEEFNTKSILAIERDNDYALAG